MNNVILSVGVAISRLGLIGGLLSVTSILSSSHLFFDLLSNFRIQYIVLIAGVIVVALLCRKILITAVLSVCLAVHVFDVARAWHLPAVESSFEGDVVRVMVSNLLSSNTAYDKHIEYIHAIDPDIIVFPEFTGHWETALGAALTDYSFRVTAPIDNPFGIALYSKLPLSDDKTTYLEHRDRPSVEAVATIGEKTLSIFGTHPPPPTSTAWYLERNRHLLKIASKASALATPMVVLGDLNVTPWSAHFRQFIREGNLKDGRRGLGLLPTWPSFVGFLQIPIDHVVVNDAAQVIEMGVSDGLLSDHKTLWADIRLR